MMVLIIALTVAIAIPCVYLYFGIYKRDFFQTGNVTLMVYCFVWGAFAWFLAAQINSRALAQGWVTRDELVRYSAPILEEILKGAILVYLVSRSDFTYFVDGATYGFTAGVGFAVLENVEYVTGHPEAALPLALARVFSTNLIHASACGLIGVALGTSRFERAGSARRLSTLLVSVIAAMGLHMAFNNLVSRGAPILLAVAVGCTGFVLIVLILQRGMRDLKGWVNEELKEESRVTNNEVTIVNQFEAIDKLLAPFVLRFGTEKGRMAKEMLLWQAQLGIYRKTAEKHQDERMRQAAEKQVAELRQKMEGHRNKLGWYCMLFLRALFPEEGNPWWAKMEASMQAPKELAGTGLWSNLNRKTKDAETRTATEAE